MVEAYEEQEGADRNARIALEEEYRASEADFKSLLVEAQERNWVLQAQLEYSHAETIALAELSETREQEHRKSLNVQERHVQEEAEVSRHTQRHACFAASDDADDAIPHDERPSVF